MSSYDPDLNELAVIAAMISIKGVRGEVSSRLKPKMMTKHGRLLALASEFDGNGIEEFLLLAQLSGVDTEALVRCHKNVTKSAYKVAINNVVGNYKASEINAACARAACDFASSSKALEQLRHRVDMIEAECDDDQGEDMVSVFEKLMDINTNRESNLDLISKTATLGHGLDDYIGEVFGLNALIGAGGSRKSWFLDAIALANQRKNKRVTIFTNEMSKFEWGSRRGFVHSDKLSGMTHAQIMDGRADIQALMDAHESLRIASGHNTILRVQTDFEKLKSIIRSNIDGADLYLIDHSTTFDNNSKKQEWEFVGKIARELAIESRDNLVPIVLACHPTREVEKNGMPKGIYGGSAIEKYARTTMFIYEAIDGDKKTPTLWIKKLRGREGMGVSFSLTVDSNNASFKLNVPASPEGL